MLFQNEAYVYKQQNRCQEMFSLHCSSSSVVFNQTVFEDGHKTRDYLLSTPLLCPAAISKRNIDAYLSHG